MKYQPTLFKETFTYKEHYNNALRTAELISESKTLEALEELLEKDPKNNIYKHALYLKTKGSEWWEDSNNFPCVIIAQDGMMSLVHYAKDDYAYDLRDNPYQLYNSNWGRATREEMLLLSNFKN